MTDILLDDDTNDLDFRGGDVVVGEATLQHTKHLLLAEKGDYRQFPGIGIGLSAYLDDDNPGEMVRDVIRQLELDGQTVNAVGYDENTGKLNIESTY